MIYMDEEEFREIIVTKEEYEEVVVPQIIAALKAHERCRDVDTEMGPDPWDYKERNLYVSGAYILDDIEVQNRSDDPVYSGYYAGFGMVYFDKLKGVPFFLGPFYWDREIWHRLIHGEDVPEGKLCDKCKRNLELRDIDIEIKKDRNHGSDTLRKIES